MRLRSLVFAATTTLLMPGSARADVAGADVAVLVEILRNSLQQLYQLMAIVKSTQDNLALVRNINRGINDSLAMAQTMRLDAVPGLYSELRSNEAALKKITSLYGSASNSRQSEMEKNADRNVAEGIVQHNAAFAQAGRLDVIGEQIKSASHQVSPGGAQKLTAESIGVLIHSVDESLRTQAMGVKLQAESLAAENHREKEATKYLLGSTATLKAAMKSESTQFATPRF